ncbi:bifunctional homocysteine S-methyltransferase/methylenetetrahydrofolate reductase [Tannockella kyphosi]|uniref:bifunctional homocysteine S-methyltransferase/methylenetetrahydrofolate reductase n=1 Tax=Tannockella kyphosi TaxID=2899121 RepID=UPI00201139F6|nr:bifunctional homocysteine S-methyltransferase/methylenetetrahydrofolate reductase [Tannockella kyphosi]
MAIKEFIQENVLLFDGAMGTYFSSVFHDPTYRCEYANITSPLSVEEIHRRYLQAGAKAIKTNTFLANDKQIDSLFPYQDIIQAGYQLAINASKDRDAYVFCDIGPIHGLEKEDYFKEYKKVVDVFLSLGASYFLFETMSEFDPIKEVIQYIKENNKDAYVIVSFAVSAQGYTNSGLIGEKLLLETKGNKDVDAVGLNCICGPYDLYNYIQTISVVPDLIMPNAGYPTIIGERTHYQNNSSYFALQMINIVSKGVKMIGGCCGTTPEFIKDMEVLLESSNQLKVITSNTTLKKRTGLIKNSPFYEAIKNGHQPIAVELDPPKDDDIFEFMNRAKQLKQAGVDLVTIADNPVARVRMDSSLVACKLKRELGLEVMPHLTCRDRNVNATKSLLLGLSVEEIKDILIVTGDPIPSEQRNEVKAVYEFNSRMLMNHINNLNTSMFQSPFYIYGALNINAKNFDIQLRLANDKIKNGAIALFSQPVYNQQALDNLKRAKKELSVPIIGGIMPIVSYRNACFMNNEIPGISIGEEIVEQFYNKSKEECYHLAIQLSMDMIDKMKDVVDGYYLISPFNRVDLIKEIMEYIKQ